MLMVDELLRWGSRELQQECCRCLAWEAVSGIGSLFGSFDRIVIWQGGPGSKVQARMPALMEPHHFEDVAVPVPDGGGSMACTRLEKILCAARWLP